MTALSVAADRFVTALIWGGPFLVGAVVVAILALWACGLVTLDKRSSLLFPDGLPTSDEQREAS